MISCWTLSTGDCLGGSIVATQTSCTRCGRSRVSVCSPCSTWMTGHLAASRVGPISTCNARSAGRRICVSQTTGTFGAHRRASWGVVSTAAAAHGEEGSESRSASPAAHCVHDVCPAGEYSPAAQAVQAVAGLESKSAVPAAQSVQDVEPCAAYWPLEQLAHAEEGSLSESAVPAAQSVHAAVPTSVF